jgi:hypothetical protein
VVPRVLASAKRRAASEQEGGGGGPGGGEEPDVAADGGVPVGPESESSDDIGWTDGEPTNLERIVAKFSRELQDLVPGDGGDER